MSDVKLKPTYWRTCRALANEDRLRLFKAVVENEGRFSVRQYARLLGLQDDVASVYLRQMNARGLLGVRREHIKVFYNLNRDRSLPQAAELQKALATYMRGNLPDGWEATTSSRCGSTGRTISFTRLRCQTTGFACR